MGGKALRDGDEDAEGTATVLWVSAIARRGGLMGDGRCTCVGGGTGRVAGRASVEDIGRVVQVSIDAEAGLLVRARLFGTIERKRREGERERKGLPLLWIWGDFALFIP